MVLVGALGVPQEMISLVSLFLGFCGADLFIQQARFLSEKAEFSTLACCMQIIIDAAEQRNL